MRKGLFHLITFYIFLEVRCGYSPIGNERQEGNVLLPSTPRGRYLAEIIRRQAVDGTEIEFNEEADKINAEAKKKTKIHSEEVLPYIIAEQERRITLHKRVMSAIQNGENGCTIAEMRKKPPVIIRKGQMFRCPLNRKPLEPDGSGIIKCEDGIDPTPIMFDSCLSAEDEELFVTNENYYLCNRHRVKGPDLPRSETTVYGCPPCERTPLLYTRKKCALEDSDDVVLHYRYYPDKVHKSVTEIDPDREVCEQWTPCQIGYIFSLPSPDQATTATELWPEVYVGEDFQIYEMEEIVPPVPEDTHKVYVNLPTMFETGIKVPIPSGLTYVGIGKYSKGADGRKHKDPVSSRVSVEPHHVKNIDVDVEETDKFDKIVINFRPMEPDDIGTYFIEFMNVSNPEQSPKVVEFVEFEEAVTEFIPKTIEAMPGEQLNQTQVNISCTDCSVKVVLVRGEDGSLRNLDFDHFRIHKISDEYATLEIDYDIIQPHDFGEYFVDIVLVDGTEERIKVVTVKKMKRDEENELKITKLVEGGTVEKPFLKNVNSSCDDCEINDILCNGESMLGSGHVVVTKKPRPTVIFSFPSFEDSNACVYMAKFTKNETKYYTTIAVIENDSPQVEVDVPPAPVEAPPEGKQFEKIVPYRCRECYVDKVLLNGIRLFANTRKTDMGAIPFFVIGDHKIIVRITEYVPMLQGVDQAVFQVNGKSITKTLLEIGKNHEEKAPIKITESTGSGIPEEKSTNKPYLSSTAAAIARRRSGYNKISTAKPVLKTGAP